MKKKKLMVISYLATSLLCDHALNEFIALTQNVAPKWLFSAIRVWALGFWDALPQISLGTGNGQDPFQRSLGNEICMAAH